MTNTIMNSVYQAEINMYVYGMYCDNSKLSHTIMQKYFNNNNNTDRDFEIFIDNMNKVYNKIKTLDKMDSTIDIFGNVLYDACCVTHYKLFLHFYDNKHKDFVNFFLNTMIKKSPHFVNELTGYLFLHKNKIRMEKRLILLENLLSNNSYRYIIFNNNFFQTPKKEEFYGFFSLFYNKYANPEHIVEAFANDHFHFEKIIDCFKNDNIYVMKIIKRIESLFSKNKMKIEPSSQAFSFMTFMFIVELFTKNILTDGDILSNCMNNTNQEDTNNKIYNMFISTSNQHFNYFFGLISKCKKYDPNEAEKMFFRKIHNIYSKIIFELNKNTKYIPTQTPININTIMNMINALHHILTNKPNTYVTEMHILEFMMKHVIGEYDANKATKINMFNYFMMLTNKDLTISKCNIYFIMNELVNKFTSVLEYIGTIDDSHILLLNNDADSDRMIIVDDIQLKMEEYFFVNLSVLIANISNIIFNEKDILYNDKMIKIFIEKDLMFNSLRYLSEKSIYYLDSLKQHTRYSILNMSMTVLDKGYVESVRCTYKHLLISINKIANLVKILGFDINQEVIIIIVNVLSNYMLFVLDKNVDKTLSMIKVRNDINDKNVYEKFTKLISLCNDAIYSLSNDANFNSLYSDHLKMFLKIDEKKKILTYSNIDKHIHIGKMKKILNANKNYVLPNEFLDPLLCTEIKDPVMLPNINDDIFFDKACLKIHFMTNNINPYTREYMTIDDLNEYNDREDVKKKNIDFLKRKREFIDKLLETDDNNELITDVYKYFDNVHLIDTIGTNDDNIDAIDFTKMNVTMMIPQYVAIIEYILGHIYQ